MAESLLLKSALKYALTMGWKIIPLRGKVPLTKHGSSDGSSDPDQIRSWWKKWPNANIGIVTGENVFVLDVDTKTGGDLSLEQLEHEHGPLPDTLLQLTPTGGRHYVFLTPDFPVSNSQSMIAPGLDVRGTGGYIVAAPSLHPANGKCYIWDGLDPLQKQPLVAAPPWLLAALKKGAANHNGIEPLVPEKIPKGKQHATLVSVAGSMRARGLGTEEIFAALTIINASRCSEPGPVKNIRQIAESVGRYPTNGSNGHAQVIAPQPAAVKQTLSDVQKAFSRWLYLPDSGVVTLALGSIAANRMDGNPVWLLLIGPPASGKTEILDSVMQLPDMHAAGTITEAALLSGVPRREHASNATGGLLRAIGDFGFIVLKDLTSTLSMSRETRSLLLAALREIHDGAWTRHFGTDGGKSLHWRGKCALIGGCTPIIDEHHGVMASMGERFLLCRMGDIDTRVQARRALDHLGKETEMRAELTAAVNGLFQDFKPAEFELDEDTRDQLSALAAFTARARSAVIRDNYKRDIDLVPGSERPARLVLALARLFHGMRVIGAEEREAWRLIASLALDCIPEIRRRVFEHVYHETNASTSDISLAVDYPTTTTRRALEDLAAHGVLTRISRGPGRSDEWHISPVCNSLVGEDTTFPEMFTEVKRKH